jgi:hypothetical protein
MQAWRACVMLCVLLVAPASSIMFDLPSGKVKCFSEDLPANTMVVGCSQTCHRVHTGLYLHSCKPTCAQSCEVD